MTLILVSFSAFKTSKYNGSPDDPASLVRSKTATLVTVFGNTLSK